MPARCRKADSPTSGMCEGSDDGGCRDDGSGRQRTACIGAITVLSLPDQTVGHRPHQVPRPTAMSADGQRVRRLEGPVSRRQRRQRQSQLYPVRRYRISINQSTNQSTNQSINQSIKSCLYNCRKTGKIAKSACK